MRTTVIFEDDVAAAIRQIREERAVGVSELVNDLVRTGLTARHSEPREPFVQQTSHMGQRIDVSNIAEVLETLDGPGHR